MNTYLWLSIAFFMISVFTARYKTKNKFNIIFNTLLIFLYLAITIMYFSADYFTGEGINQAVLFTLEYGLDGAGFGEYEALISVTVFLFAVTFALTYIYYRIINNKEHPKPKKLKGVIHNVFLVFAFLAHPFILDLYSIYNSMHIKQSNDFHEYYKKQTLIEQKGNGYNLVYIYAESLEKTYFDQDLFPELLPNLKELKEQSTEFTNINQIVGSGWTIGGMVTSQCSIPLFTTSQGNSMGGSDRFLSGAKCLGDILKDMHYELVFMEGASAIFSGQDKFYKTHSFDTIYSREELTGKLENDQYLNGWGLYDDSLFPMVYKEFTKLSKSDKNFGLFIATMDTHHYSGQTSESCNDIPYKDGKNSILNAVHCSDRLISQFINKIKKSEYAEKTIIVLTSDHLAMKNTASKLLEKNQKERRDLFLIFDPKEKKYKSIDKAGSMLDVAPTILHKLDIKTGFGLGRDLFVEKSLYNMFDDFNKKLLSWRDSILQLWEYPALATHYEIDLNNKQVNISNHSYGIPVLFKIKDDNSLMPFFEINSPIQLTTYLEKATESEKFIWVDMCMKIHFIFKTNTTNGFCVAQGALSDNVEIIPLEKNITKISTIKLIHKIDKKSKLYSKRIKLLKEYNTCKHPAKGKISIISSTFPVLRYVPSAFRTYNKTFPGARGLNLLTLDYNGNYRFQNFDVYASEEEANAFIKTIELLIQQKKFWVVMSSDTINNVYRGYKEKLLSLGFKVLGALNSSVAYIGYQDKDGVIHEFSDGDSICKVIPSFITPLSDAEKEKIEYDRKQRYAQAKIKSKDTSRFIAHAGGMIDGHAYTDSLEALDASYAKGFRFFELDIIETSDHVFVASHDWKSWQKMSEYQGGIPSTVKVFKRYKIKGKYTPMDMDDINKWFTNHPDAILVTDKINKPLEFSNKFIDKNRLMMELFSWEAVQKGLDAGIKSAMPTGGILRSISGDKIAYLKKMGIKNIAASRRMADVNRRLVEKIANSGIRIYAFHVNFDKGKDEKYVLCEEGQYFYGMYADKWDFNKTLECP